MAFTLIKVFSALNFCTELITKIPLFLPLTCVEFKSFEYLAILSHRLYHLEFELSDTILGTYRFLLILLPDLVFPNRSNSSGKNSSKKYPYQP